MLPGPSGASRSFPSTAERRCTPTTTTSFSSPASNTKLFTTATAFALLGPDFRFHTTVETAGTIDKHGRLDSDLVIVGRGDPNLSGRTLPYNLRTERKLPPIIALENLADQLVQKGLRYVDGDIVADDSYYAFERYGEGWAQDDLVWEWGAPGFGADHQR